MIDKAQACLAFSRAAASYDAAALLQREIGERMLQRLDYIKAEPNTILDAGTGTGMCAAHLLKRYTRAEVIALDFALPMVEQAKRQRHWLRRPHGVCADFEQLPLKDQSIDLIVSNAAIQWCTDLSATFCEFRRVLRPGGLLMFTTFGPDTLTEIRQAWAMVDDMPHVSPFIDMHDVGDALLGAQFADPVIDMEIITMTYEKIRTLLQDIKSIGAHNVTEERHRGLTGKARMQAFFDAYEAFRQDGLLPSTWEVVYGHAWVTDQPPRHHQDPSITTISVDALRGASG